ncbi:hypothetical protein ACHQM5_018223 [Ranunculus cassubicifolius]
MEGEDEIKALIKVSTTILISLTFCHFIARKIPQGITRFVSILPIISIFTFLPLLVSSIHFIVIITGFITWICSSKLILFAFNQGPLSSQQATSLLDFIFIACLPIQIKQEISRKGPKSTLNYVTKAFLLALVLHISTYKPYIHPNFMLILYCFQAYFSAEIILAISAVPARVLFGYEIEPQFDDPYLATSLQDFWGKRWNLMISSSLRPTVYLPVRSICTPIVGRNGALMVGLLMTFVVSGLMHELVYFYATRGVRPTWEVTSFFVLQGVCTALEIMAKKKFGEKWRLHPIVSGPLTVAFVVITGCWLFFAQVVRNELDLKIRGEYGALAQFIKSAGLKGAMVLHHLFG